MQKPGLPPSYEQPSYPPGTVAEPATSGFCDEPPVRDRRYRADSQQAHGPHSSYISVISVPIPASPRQSPREVWRNEPGFGPNTSQPSTFPTQMPSRGHGGQIPGNSPHLYPGPYSQTTNYDASSSGVTQDRLPINRYGTNPGSESSSKLKRDKRRDNDDDLVTLQVTNGHGGVMYHRVPRSTVRCMRRMDVCICGVCLAVAVIVAIIVVVTLITKKKQ